MVVSRTSMKVGITTANAISHGLTDRRASGTCSAAALIEGRAQKRDQSRILRLEASCQRSDR